MICIDTKDSEYKKYIQGIVTILYPELKEDEKPNAAQYALAHHIACCNNGKPIELDPYGNHSKLWDDLLSLYRGDKRAALFHRSYIYTTQYIAQHGDWMFENKPEPQLSEISNTSAEFSVCSELFRELDKASAAKTDEVINELVNYRLFHESKKLMVQKHALQSNQELEKELSDAFFENIEAEVHKKITNDSKCISVGDVTYTPSEYTDMLLKEYIDVASDGGKRLLSDDKLTEFGEFAKDMTRQKLRNDSIHEKISEIVVDIKEELIKSWGIELDAGGLAINHLESQKDDYVFIDDNGNENSSKTVYGVNPYIVQQVRCNIINNLFKFAEDPVYLKKMVPILTALYTESSNKHINISKTIMHTYLEVLENSPIIIKLLRASGLLQSPAKDYVGREAEYRSLIKSAINKLENDYDDIVYNYVSDKKLNIFQKLWFNIAQAAKCILKLAFYSSGKLSKWPIIIGIGTGWITGSFLIGTGAWLVSKGVNYAHKAMNRAILTTDMLTAKERQTQLGRLMLAASACKYIDDGVDTNDIDDTYTILHDDDDYIYNVIHGLKKEPFEVQLARIRSILVSQLASMKSIANKQTSSVTRMDEITNLLKECNRAMDEGTTNEQSSFLLKYINQAKRDVAQTLDQLEKLYQLNPEDIDPKVLDSVRTEVVGAYAKILTGSIQDAIRYNQRFSEGFKQIVMKSFSEIKIKQLLNTYDQVSKKYCEWVIKQGVSETAANIVNELARSNIEKNMNKWMNGEINGGRLSFLDANIFAANTSTSPVVRFITQKLEEIEANVIQEIQGPLNELEEIRDKRGHLHLSPIADLHKYCEKDEEGNFTAYFVSPVKAGKYQRDRKKIKDELLKKFGLKLKNNSLTTDEHFVPFKCNFDINGSAKTYTIVAKESDVKDDNQITAWQAYHIAMVIWEAGGSVGNNEYSLFGDEEPRAIKRFVPEYYIQKYIILGKDGISKLSSLDQQISQIRQSNGATQVIDTPSGKKTVFVKAKLTPSQRVLLDQLENEKRFLSSSKKVNFSSDGRVEFITDKSEAERELSIRFLKWESQKRKWRQRNWKVKDDVSGNTYTLQQLDNMLKSGNIVEADYVRMITKLYQEHNFASQTHKDVDMEEYENVVNELSKTLSPEQLEQFKKDNTEYLPRSEFMEQIALGNMNMYKEDFDDPNYILYMSSIKALNAIKKSIEARDKDGRVYYDITKIGSFDTVSASEQKEYMNELWKSITDVEENISIFGDTLGKRTLIFDKTDLEQRGNVFGMHKQEYVDPSTGEIQPNLLFLNWVLSTFGVELENLKYRSGILLNSQRFTSSLFYSERLNEEILRQYGGFKETPGATIYQQIYLQIPNFYYRHVSEEEDGSMVDGRFDDTNSDSVLVNPLRPEYDNSVAYNKIKNDELYKKILEVMDAGWACYEGFTRSSRYLMPQRYTTVRNMVSRAFASPGRFWKTVGQTKERIRSKYKEFLPDELELGATSGLLARADGSIVEAPPSRFISMLDETNMVDTDIISSVADFFLEAVRYKYRCRMQPLMETLCYQAGGGTQVTAAAPIRNLVEQIRGELSRALYGRTLTGSGYGGRITANELKYVNISRALRSVAHKRLMAHNLTSVIKNAVDSFFNLINQAVTGKYIRWNNLRRGIFKMFRDKENGTTVISAVKSIHNSKARNMTQALMELNDISMSMHDRFAGKNKIWIRRGESKTFEFEIIDYTAKAMITEAVYDSFRLVKNINTNTWQFMSSNQIESAYEAAGLDPEDGYKVWYNSKYTLRDMYSYNSELGIAELKDGLIQVYEQNGISTKLNILDLVRPKSKLSISEDGRSRVLETMIKTEIRHISSVVNGMLDTADKNVLSKNYIGALVTSFRGWMMSQGGEFNKDGYDFYDYDTPADLAVYHRSMFRDMFDKDQTTTKPSIQNKNLMGQYDFTTGLVSRGLHKNVWSTLCDHLGVALRMFLTFDIGTNKYNRMRENKMSKWEYTNLKNLIFLIHSILILIFSTACAYSWQDAGDDKDWATGIKKLIWASLLASVSERFSQVGQIGYLSQILELVKSVSVESVLLDDAHFILDTLMNIKEFLSDDSAEISGGISISNPMHAIEVLQNGTYKGLTKFRRNIMRAAPLILGDMDFLPYLLLLDCFKITPFAPDWIKNTVWADLDLNFYRSHSASALDAKGKFYTDLASPARYVFNGIQDYVQGVLQDAGIKYDRVVFTPDDDPNRGRKQKELSKPTFGNSRRSSGRSSSKRRAVL